jgi:hypothetical protein
LKVSNIHAQKHDAPELYRRRLRELVGHHEGIGGLVDSYDEATDAQRGDVVTGERLLDFERRCLGHRHRLKAYSRRLRRVHGDFHPWNVLFGEDDLLTLLDRSRGAWGEPADDVSAMAINYLFYALRTESSRRLTGPFATLWRRFFEAYLDATGDDELGLVIQPYLAFRALVVASPVWYPTIELPVRAALFRFVDHVLDVERFDHRDADALLCGGP